MTASVFALAPSEDVGFVLQLAALGALLGTAVAAWQRRRDPDSDTWWPSAVGALAAATFALLIVLWQAVR